MAEEISTGSLDAAPAAEPVLAAGARVAAHLMQGEVIEGRLESDAAGDHLRLARPDGLATEIPHSRLRYLVMFDAPRDGKAAFAGEPQPFTLTYVDGKELGGLAYGLAADPEGLRVYGRDAKGNQHLMFVPNRVLRRYRVGPLLGESLVAAKAVAPGKVEAALKTQEAQRARKLGTYLRSSIALTAEDLKHAIEDQAKAHQHKLGEVLIAEGLISVKQLAYALELQKRDRGQRIGDILVEMGAVTAEAVHGALARSLGVPFVKLQDFDVEPTALGLVTRELARKHGVMPLMLHAGRLVVAMQDPMDMETNNLLRFTTGQPIEVVVATSEDIERAIKRHYVGAGGRISELQLLESLDADPAHLERMTQEEERLGRESPIVRLVHRLIIDGIARRASDVHMHPTQDRVDLLYRIDGALVPVRNFKKSVLRALVSRIKILGRMNIAERRLPQDGSTRVVHEGKVVDLRISVIPTVDGESVVIRILNTQFGLRAISQLGFVPQDEARFADLLHRSNGLVLVTGPTGCGKSTTLYAAVGEVRKQNVNLITVEDPVEYHIDGIEQIQVHPVAGYSFAKALRHILRHDPDVIMIGEIRDAETAKIAVESALTGHLVLSTLHTNDAASAVTRLMEIGVEPYLLSATLLGVLAQRLVRCNCRRCIAAEEIDPGIRKLLGVREDEVFYRGRGCEECNHTGYSGRMAVYELMRATSDLRDLVTDGVTSAALHEHALKEGMTALTQNAIFQARQRRTSLAEVYRVRLE
jgi:type IV pilus assembly protein PilB